MREIEHLLQAQQHNNAISAQHFVYIVECNDHSLYTGYAKDVTRRIALHNAGKGAKYTRSRHPVSLRASWQFQHKGEALRIEAAIKRLTHTQKWQLILSHTVPVVSPQ